MKKSIYILLCAAVFVCGCKGGNGTSKTQKKGAIFEKADARSPLGSALDKYAVVDISTPDLSEISENGRQVLNLYHFAAMHADKIYWKQVFGDKDTLERIDDAATREYAMVNYGPWDLRTGKPFVEGYGEMPKGANFYPKGMKAEEFDACTDPLKMNPYTVIERAGKDSLKAVWYHDKYPSNVHTISTCLRTAADITIVPSVSEYLKALANAVLTDDYAASDRAWMNVTDSKMDLILGPNEVKDDFLYGVKKSYESYVLLKNLKKTPLLEKYATRLEELQKALPCKDEYKTFVPGGKSVIYDCNMLYCGGSANAGTKLLALNLPVDEKLQEELGTRTIILGNVIDAKYAKIISPAATALLTPEQKSNVDKDAFYWYVVFREVAHGLGVKETVNGKGTVSEALGVEAPIMEEVKGLALGAYYASLLASKHELNMLSTKENVLATYVVGLIRAARIGSANTVGLSNIICYNYLREKGAFNFTSKNVYTIDYPACEKALESLCAEILEIQATGDKEAARKFTETYGKVGEDLEAAFVQLRLENIPIDIRFVYADED